MKNFYLLLSFLVIGFSAEASENFDRPNYGDAFIFVERGVEFAVFPDGQFDFFYNPRKNFNRVPTHINYSFNSGYNYGPFVQYDDYGAVIQIENVPVYYDYYGRIIQAGRVQIGYNSFGSVNRIGNMFLHYNHYDRFTHTSGFINSRNAHYIYRPWHDHYVRPYDQYSVVFHQPYRLYYNPNRVKYSYYRKYYNNHYNDHSFQKSYHRPGDQVTAYSRGRRVEAPRNIRSASSSTRSPAVNNVQQRSVNRQTEVREIPGNTRNVQRQTRTSRAEVPAYRAEVPAVEKRSVPANTRSSRVEAPAVKRDLPQTRSSVPARKAQVQSNRVETPEAVRSPQQVRTPDPVSRTSRSSRGQ